MMGIGFLFFCYNVIWSVCYGECDIIGDLWDGCIFEWVIYFFV